jgi:DNA transposition AAA+ family ATPase
MNILSHPEKEERDRALESQPGSDSDNRNSKFENRKSARPCNQILRQKLRELRAGSPIYSNAELGKKLGYSASVLSQYLSDDGNKYDGNISLLEKKAEDFLQALERRRASGIETAPAKVADEMFVAFEYIRKTNDLGAIIAESGEGKSRGIELILKKNELTILVEATEWNRSIHGVMNSLWTACAVDGWDRSCQRFPFLVQKMRGSDRPIIIDDAHKLSRDALSLLATFQEKNQVPHRPHRLR